MKRTLIALLTGSKQITLDDEFLSNPDFPYLFELVVSCDSPLWALALLDKLSLLDPMLPELARCRGVSQNLYHHLPVFEHTLLCLGRMEAILGDPKSELRVSQDIAVKIQREKKALIIAAIAHDFGKPDTVGVRKDGYASFHRHEQVSAELFDEMADRLRIASPLADMARLLIAGHMYVAPIALRYARKDAGEKSVRRILARHPDTWPQLAALAVADVQATLGPWAKVGVDQVVIDFLSILESTQIKQEEEKRRVRMVDGRLIMARYGLMPGKKVGQALEIAQEIQDNNPGIGTESILRHLDKILDSKN